MSWCQHPQKDHEKGVNGNSYCTLPLCDCHDHDGVYTPPPKPKTEKKKEVSQ